MNGTTEETTEISQTHETKPCSYCHERINAKSIKCRYCHEFQVPKFRDKPYWHWLRLIIVPATLLLLSGLLALFQRHQDNMIESNRIEANSTVEANRISAAALQSYLDDMSLILFENKMSEPNVTTTMRAYTWATMSELDAERNDFLLTFLREAGLLDWILSDAELEQVDLSYTDLTGANLNGANLRNANLRGAIMNGTLLINADLRGADLREVVLGHNNVGGNQDWRFANLSGARLQSADLRKAYLFGTDLRGAFLSSTIMGDLINAGSDLNSLNSKGADLSGAWLYMGVDLRGAYLGDTNFSGTTYDGFTKWPEDFDQEAAGAEPAGGPVPD